MEAITNAPEYKATGPLFTVLYRHPSHPAHRWMPDTSVFDDAAAARAHAREIFSGTGIVWRLMTTPGWEA